MNRIAKVLSGVLVAGLMLASLPTFAATSARDFNHMTTGFPLSGGHAVAACETCHVGGVFKGTPKNCDGCHAVGKRVVATPKTNSHIVTDAACESCHFNTSTWLGARYNHGNAQPGGCLTCHNGRLSVPKPSTHTTGNKATKSCDSCHRPTAWLPASWNHNNAAGLCSTCHVSSPEVSAPNRKPASHVASAIKGQLECDSCHNYIGWYPNRFKHNTPDLCSSCHNGTKAIGKPAGHVATQDECNQCHYTAVAWSPALGGKPANHINYTTASCTSCHTTGGGILTVQMHNYVTAQPCITCHLNTTTFMTNRATKKKIGHEGMKAGQDCISCHARQYTKWNNP